MPVDVLLPGRARSWGARGPSRASSAWFNAPVVADGAVAVVSGLCVFLVAGGATSGSSWLGAALLGLLSTVGGRAVRLRRRALTHAQCPPPGVRHALATADATLTALLLLAALSLALGLPVALAGALLAASVSATARSVTAWRLVARAAR